MVYEITLRLDKREAEALTTVLANTSSGPGGPAKFLYELYSVLVDAGIGSWSGRYLEVTAEVMDVKSEWPPEPEPVNLPRFEVKEL